MYILFIYEILFFGIFLRKPEPRDTFFCLCKTAHFLIKRCTFSARGKFFAPGPRGKIFADPLTAIIIAESGNPYRQSRFGEFE